MLVSKWGYHFDPINSIFYVTLAPIAYFIALQVNIALECAKVQQWLSLPPLEMDNFPQINLTDSKIQHFGYLQDDPKERDILQELLSVDCNSQGLDNQSHYQDKWEGLYPSMEEFSALSEQGIVRHVEEKKKGQISEMGSSRFIERSYGVEENIRYLENGDLEEEFREERVVENLQGENISNRNLGKVWLTFFNLLLDC